MKRATIAIVGVVVVAAVAATVSTFVLSTQDYPLVGSAIDSRR